MPQDQQKTAPSQEIVTLINSVFSQLHAGRVPAKPELERFEHLIRQAAVDQGVQTGFAEVRQVRRFLWLGRAIHLIVREDGLQPAGAVEQGVLLRDLFVGDASTVNPKAVLSL